MQLRTADYCAWEIGSEAKKSDLICNSLNIFWLALGYATNFWTSRSKFQSLRILVSEGAYRNDLLKTTLYF